ncbi:MAG: hypothetical protein WCB15_06560 [Desulfobacterales bacterium]
MKKTLNKPIPALAVAIFIMAAPVAQGIRSMAPGGNPERTEIVPLATVWHKPIMLAQNEDDTAGDKDRTATATGDRVSEVESGSVADPKDPSANSKAAPLKPFKPSEEIAAEQAVDFPVDI